MNALLDSSGLLDALATWIVDYFAAATVVLAAALAARLALRQPAARVAVAWSASLGLVALAVLTAWPAWPRFAVGDLAAKSPAAPAADSFQQPEANVLPAALPIDAFTQVEPIELANYDPAVPTTTAPDASGNTRLDWRHVAAGAWLAVAALAMGWVLLGHWRARVLLAAAVKAPQWAWDELRAIVQRTARNATADTARGAVGNALRGVPSEAGNATGAVPYRRELALPALLASRQIATAAALGAIGPKILLPISSLAEANRPAVRAALAHEWAHIRHGDLWLLAVERLLMPLLAVHPLFWWMRRSVRFDQELLADAAAAGDEPDEYAEALLVWARTAQPARHGLAALSMWEHPSTLSRRVAMILDPKRRIAERVSHFWTAATVAIAIPSIVALSAVSLRPTTAQEKDAASATEAAIGPTRLADKAPPPPPLTRAANVPVIQVHLELLVASVSCEKLAAADTTLEDAIAEATESRCRKEAGLVVSEINPEEVVKLMDGLKKHEAIKVLSRPQVITLDGREANVRVGGEVPILRVEETINGKHEQRVEYTEFGTLLMVRPKLTGEQADVVTLDILAEQSRLVPPGEKAEHGAVPRDVPGLVSHKFTLRSDVKLGGTLLVAESPADKKQLRNTDQEQFLLVITPQRAIRPVAAVDAHSQAGENGAVAPTASAAATGAATAAEPEPGSAAAALLQREREARARETAQLKRQIVALEQELAKVRDATGLKIVTREYQLKNQDPQAVAEALSRLIGDPTRMNFAIEKIGVGPQHNSIVVRIAEKYVADIDQAIENLDRPIGPLGSDDPWEELMRKVLESRKATSAPSPAEQLGQAHAVVSRAFRLPSGRSREFAKRFDDLMAKPEFQGKKIAANFTGDRVTVYAPAAEMRELARLVAELGGEPITPSSPMTEGPQPGREPAVHRAVASARQPNWGVLTADVAEARLELERAEKEFARVQQLHEAQAISQEEVDRKQYELEKAKIQLRRSEAQLYAVRPAAELSAAAPQAGESRPVSRVTEQRLLELDLADAKLAVEEAEAELARAEQIRKQSPAAISEPELRKYALQAERAKIQVQRIMVRLEAIKGEEGTGR